MKTLALAALFLACWASPLFAQHPAAAAPGAHHETLARKSWLVRLTPTTQDRTAAQKDLVQQHHAYWKARFDQGVCLFGGSVFDPHGEYAVLAIRAESKQVATNITSHDPAVAGGLMRAEIVPMAIAFPPLTPAQETHP